MDCYGCVAQLPSCQSVWDLPSPVLTMFSSSQSAKLIQSVRKELWDGSYYVWPGWPALPTPVSFYTRQGMPWPWTHAALPVSASRVFRLKALYFISLEIKFSYSKSLQKYILVFISYITVIFQRSLFLSQVCKKIFFLLSINKALKKKVFPTFSYTSTELLACPQIAIRHKN